MNAPTRALLTLLAAGVTGALLWVATQLDTQSTDGYYAAHGLIAVGGLLLGLAQLRAAGTGRPSLPLLVIAPAVLAALWLIAIADPDSNWFRDQLRSWSSDLGIAGAVSDIARWNGALALGVGLLVGLTTSPGLRARRQTPVAPPATAPPVRVEEPYAPAAEQPVVVVEQAEPERVAELAAASASRPKPTRNER